MSRRSCSSCGKISTIGVWAESLADVAEDWARQPPARHPEVRRSDLSPAFDHRLGQANLAVKLEGSRLHGQRARGRSRLGRFVDDPHAHTKPREPQGQYQSRRPRANDQDFGVATRSCIHLLT